MRAATIFVLAVAAAWIASAAAAQPKATFESLWRDATVGEHRLTDRGDFTMVETGDVYYYFAKPGHYAYPGVVRRAIKERNGRYFIDTQGWSFAAQAGQPGFHRWLKEFDELNRRLMRALERR